MAQPYDWSLSRLQLARRRPSSPRGGVTGIAVRFSGTITSPITRDDVIKCLQDAEGEIQRLGVWRLALFGSIIRREAQPDSDVDLLVEFRAGEKSFDRFLELCELLESVLGRRVELVTTEALSPYIGPHILAEAEDVLRAA